MTRGGKSYFVTFIDDYFRYTKVYLIQHKNEAFDMFLSYKTEVENQLNRKIKRLRSDRDGEYILFNDFCEKESIIHEVTLPYSPKSNGVAERKNRTLTTFLNGNLEEKIYMTQLEGCVVDGQYNKVCKLLKSLYGLKEDPKQWHGKFNETLLVDGFSSSDADRCVYTKFVNDDHVNICLYADDMFIFCTCNDIFFKSKSFLTSKFDMKDMGETSVILGVKIIRK